ncbi:MAG: 2-oxoacid:acceptor oxidoreductase subunit alpha [SAR202 cluster bacterium]|nr:2-oxoacid:acceptor oxidoreductase subunit alpha [SAR202 cluster bacterium]
MTKKNDFIVRFAGEGGQGVVTSAEGLAQAATQVGYHAQTFATFPSQIMGGPTWTQTRISTTPVRSSGDELDVLVAFNEDGYNTHKDEVRQGGVIIFNSEGFSSEPDERSFGMAFDELAKSTGNARAANMVVIGALAYLVDMPQAILEEFVRKRFTRGRDEDAQIIESNIKAMTLGRQEVSKSKFRLGELAPPTKPDYDQILVNGNTALALGALAAGLEYYVGYPISPATSILVWMERNLGGPGKFVYQVSSEIEAITAIVGAGYAGKKSMTATAGPGFSLMSEGLGLAWMAEIPLVVVDVQRGGPATGLPTKTEQSDLFSTMFPAHGDVRLPVIAPGSVEECFYAATAAFNWAERYQGPVVLLSEHALSERNQNIPKPDTSKLKIEKRKVYTGTNGYLRYDAKELSAMPLPGGPGAYVANGSEHDSMGDTTHLPSRHVQMTERRWSKLKLLEDGTYEHENEKASIAILPWGGSKGPAREAFEELRANGEDVAWYYTMFLHPMPPALLEDLKKKRLVLVPELNYQGQLAFILRAYGIKAEALTQYTGLPFKVKELVRRISERVKAEKVVSSKR